MSTELVKSTEVGLQFSFFNNDHFATMQRVAKMFCNSELVPDMYKITPENPESKAMANCIVAIEMATRIGASPLMVMQNMIMIYGRPSWSSKFLIATVNTCGRFNALKYRFENLGKVGMVDIVEYKWDSNAKKKLPTAVKFDGSNIDNWQCICYTTAKGSEELLESTPVTIDLAIKEGWYNKAGSKWTTMTKQMLTYRSASFWTSAYAPELSMGMKTEDEINDIEEIPYIDIPNKVATEIKANANKETVGFSKVEEVKSDDPDKRAYRPPVNEPKAEPATESNPI